MADSDLAVRFSGDTTQLNESIAKARQTLANFAPSTTRQASSALGDLAAALAKSKVASDIANASWRENLISLAALESLTRTSRQAYEGYAVSVLGAEFALAKWYVQQEKSLALWYAQESVKGLNWTTQTLGIQAAASALAGYLTPAAEAERSARLFVQANDGIVASAKRAIAAVGDFVERTSLSFTSLAKTELAAISAAGGLDRFVDAADRVGGAGSAKRTLDEFTASLEKIPNTSRDTAASIEEILATVPNYTVAVNDFFVNLLQQMSKNGDDALALAKKIKAAYSDDKNGGAFFGNLISQEKNLEDIQIAADRIAKTLKPDQASAFFDVLIGKLKERNNLQQKIVDQDQASIRSLPIIGNFLGDHLRILQEQVDKQKEFAAAVAVATGNLEVQKRTAESVADAIKRQDEFEKLLGTDASRAGQLSKIDDDQRKLNDPKASQSRKNTDVDLGNDRDLLIRTVIGEAGGEIDQGIAGVLNVIKNRVESGYGGANTYRDVVTAPKQFSVWNQGDAAGDYARSVSSDSAVYRKVAAMVDKLAAGDLDDPTKGATSYYNPNAASPSWGNNLTNVNQIGSHRFGNTPSSPPVRSEDDEEARIQRLQELIDKQKELNDAQQGGSNADRASLEIAQEKARNLNDQVASAQRLVDAKQDDLDSARGGSPDKVRAAEEALATAEVAYRERVAAVSKATEDLRTATTQQGTRARLDAQFAASDAEIARAGGDQAKIIELQKQKLEAQRAYNAQQAADAVSVENAFFDATQRRFRDEQSQIKANANLGDVSRKETEAALNASYTKQQQATKDHYVQLASIARQYNTDTPQEVRKNAQAAAVAEDRINQERVAAAREANQRIAQSFKSSFESVGSSIASSLEAIIERTGTFRQLMQNVAKNILGQFVQAGVRMVADWAAHQASMVAIAVLSQGQQTAAAAAGETARTGIASAGAISAAAAKAPAMIGSILASANETFAGIFGFLSPIMGPLAVGPAAAGEALVAAKAALPSFAAGSWNLPTDMVANVHAGEMIIPATVAAGVRSSLGGGAAGAPSGGDVHTHAHFNVTAMDSRDVRRFFSDHSKHIIGAINDGVRSGSHLGMSKLGKA